MKNNWLEDHRKKIASQFGEDGVIEKVFSLIKEKRDNWCVEFGAGDGKTNSNTWNLVKNKKWSAVLIEADTLRYNRCVQEYADHDDVHVVKKFVTFSGKNSLDGILSRTGIPKNFDFLSIDIDGNDYHVWDALKKHTPKVVIIEFNPSIPPSVAFVQERDMTVRQGHSLLALVRLGKRKGYELVYSRDGNAIFVKKSYFPLFGIKDNSLSALYTDRKYETRIFQLYDGTFVVDGNKKMHWNGVRIEQKHMQVLPRYLRGFDDNKKMFCILVLRFLRIYKPYIPLSDIFSKKKIKIFLRNMPITNWRG